MSCFNMDSILGWIQNPIHLKASPRYSIGKLDVDKCISLDMRKAFDDTIM